MTFDLTASVLHTVEIILALTDFHNNNNDANDMLGKF